MPRNNYSVPIKMSKKLREFLKKRGSKGESYEDVIWKFINNKLNEQGDEPSSKKDSPPKTHNGKDINSI